MKTPIDTRAIMNRQFADGRNPAELSGLSLQQLVNQLLVNSMTAAFRNKSLVINEVPREILLPKERISLAPVIRDLLAAVIGNSSKGEIYISAERYRDIVIIQVQERNNNNGYALASSLRAIEAEATLVGGNITISGAQQKVVTISFSFSNTESPLYDC